MKKRIVIASAVYLTVFFVMLYPVFCQQKEETPEEAEARRASWDKGPRTIDVSSYPPEMQEYYKVFSKKCSKCHNLARPVNATFKADEWERYIKRMMRKPGSGILSSEAKKIYEFLKYYSEQKEKAKTD